MEYFSVKNWEKYQHYKHRKPPWIKVYRSLLHDSDFLRMPVEHRYNYLAILLLASRFDNVIDYDNEFVAQQIAAKSVDLDYLERAGFIYKNQACSEMLAKRVQMSPSEYRVQSTEEDSSFDNTKEGGKPPSLNKILREKYVPIFGERIMQIAGAVRGDKRFHKLRKPAYAFDDALGEINKGEHPKSRKEFISVLSAKVYSPDYEEEKARHAFSESDIKNFKQKMEG